MFCWYEKRKIAPHSSRTFSVWYKLQIKIILYAMVYTFIFGRCLLSHIPGYWDDFWYTPVKWPPEHESAVRFLGLSVESSFWKNCIQTWDFFLLQHLQFSLSTTHLTDDNTTAQTLYLVKLIAYSNNTFIKDHNYNYFFYLLFLRKNM